ncbi:hypothetical protein BJ912DRAFT_1059483 [Pholiota molesta]|nr:hypothetical protein BJ912DRAFT_1059483 [Pholiota molesta]
MQRGNWRRHGVFGDVVLRSLSRMTEYDYSPEAFDAYLRKQQQIARWVDKTAHSPFRDPYTPATPADALRTRALDTDDRRDDSPHRRNASADRRDRPRDRPHRERDRERERPRDTRDRDRDRSRDLRDRERGSDRQSAKTHNKRNRSASHSGPLPGTRPDPQRSYTPNIGAYPHTNGYPPYTHAPKFPNPRDSRHSSRSSSTTRLPQAPSPTSYYPQQAAPWSAPPYGSMRPPHRSHTTPAYGYPQDTKYPSSANIYHQGANPSGYPNMSPPQKQYEWAHAPQYPHSMYQTKPPPLLKRLFMSLTGTGKSAKRVPRRKRSTSF